MQFTDIINNTISLHVIANGELLHYTQYGNRHGQRLRGARHWVQVAATWIKDDGGLRGIIRGTTENMLNRTITIKSAAKTD